MNYFNIQRAYQTAKDRGWDRIYFAIDVHDTIVKSNYQRDSFGGMEFYPYAKRVLQDLSKRPEACLILYTCSFEPQIQKFLKFLLDHDIVFDYVNCNPEVTNTEYGDFSKKFYYNILLDDKAGFEGEKDWPYVMQELYNWINKQ